jgi:rhodanese-related sulfurtransferase
MTDTQKLAPAEAWKNVVEGAVFLDILDDEGFSVIAYDQVDALEVSLLELLDKMPEMDRSAMYVAGGFDEAMGFKAANLLVNNGFDKVGYVAGGLKAWYEEGLPVRYNVSGGCGSHDEDEASGGCGGCSCGCG